MNEVAAAATINTDARPIELSIAEALAFAVQLHRAGELNEAEIIYSRIRARPGLRRRVAFPRILRLYRGREDEPLRSYRDRSSSILPRPTGTAISNVLLAAQRRSESIEAYKRAVAIDPTHAPALTNLGAVLALEGRTEKLSRVKQAMEANPSSPRLTTITATCLPVWGASGRGSITTARRSRSGATILTRMLVALAHTRLGHVDEAAEVFPGSGWATNPTIPLPSTCSRRAPGSTFRSGRRMHTSKRASMSSRTPSTRGSRSWNTARPT